MKRIDKILVQKESSIKEAMRVIDHGAIKIAVVVDQLKLVGIVTDGDIRRGIINGIDVNELVTKVMNPNPIVAKKGESSNDITRKVKDKMITGGVPIINSDGIVVDFAILDSDGRVSFFVDNPAKNKNLHLKNILVIGGAGYIGSVLVRQLLQKGYKVIVFDKFLYGHDSLQEILSDKNLCIIEGDTRHIEEVAFAMRDVDAVVHLAEFVGDPACALNPSATIEVNYLATKMIAEVAKNFQINRFVYSSSCSVYGANEDNSLLTETSNLNPVSLYAKMKIASEKALIDIMDDNFNPTILRLSTVFGFSYRPRFDLVVNTLTAKAFKENKITIFGGDQWRPNVHVSDVAKTITAVLESPLEEVGGEIFNVGTEINNFTINQIGELVHDAFPKASFIKEDRNIDVRNYRVSFVKIHDKIGDVIRLSVHDGICELKDFLEKNPSFDYTERKYSNIKSLEGSNLDGGFSNGNSSS